MNSNKKRPKKDLTYYKSIALVVVLQILWAFRRVLATLPNGFLVVIIGLPLLSIQFWGWAKYRHRLYLGHSIIGKYVKFSNKSWSYWVQVDRNGWVEDFEVSFPVYRVLKDGDAYTGRNKDKYASRILNRPIAFGLVERATFEWNMIESLQEHPESGYAPLHMELLWTEKTMFNQVPAYIFYVDEWDE